MAKQWVNRYFFLLIVLIMMIFILGCSKKEVKSAQEAKSPVAKILSLEKKDIAFLRDSKGLPVAVKAVSELTLAGAANTATTYTCKLSYADNLLSFGVSDSVTIDKKGNAVVPVTIISPVEKRLDITRWKTCCDISKEFTVYTTTMVCVQ